MYCTIKSVFNLISLVGITLTSIFVNCHVHEMHLKRDTRSIYIRPLAEWNDGNNSLHNEMARDLIVPSNRINTFNPLQHEGDFERMMRTSWSYPRVDNRNRYQDNFRPRARCTKNLQIQNGDKRFRERGSLVQFQCNSGYTLVGASYAICLSNAWSETIPFCVRAGCKRIVVPLNSFMRASFGGAVYYFYCNPGYSLVGSEVLTCDGTNWNGTEPTCEATDSGTTHIYDSWDDNHITNSTTLSTPTIHSPPVNTTVLNTTATNTTLTGNSSETNINVTRVVIENATQVAASNTSITPLLTATTQNPNTTLNITPPSNTNESHAKESHATDINQNLNETNSNQANSTVSTNNHERNTSLNSNGMAINASIPETTTNEVATTSVSVTNTASNTGTTVSRNATIPALNATLDETVARTTKLTTTNTPAAPAATTKPTEPPSRAVTTIPTTLRVTIPTSPRVTVPTTTTTTTTTKVPTPTTTTTTTTKAIATSTVTTVPSTIKTINATVTSTTKVTTNSTQLMSTATIRSTLVPKIVTPIRTTVTTPSIRTTSPRTVIRTTRAPTSTRRRVATTPVRTTKAARTTQATTSRRTTTPTTTTTTTTKGTTTINPSKVDTAQIHRKTTVSGPVVTRSPSVRTTARNPWTRIYTTTVKYVPHRNEDNSQDNNVPLIPLRTGEKKHDNFQASINPSKLDLEGQSTSGGHVMYTIGVIGVIIATISIMSVAGSYCWRKHYGIARARSFDMDGQTLSFSTNANDDFNYMDPYDEGL